MLLAPALFLTLFVTSAADAPPDDDRPARPRGDERRDFRGVGRVREGRHDRMRQYLDATPEQRRQMRLERIERMLDGAYRFTDEQRPAVHDELQRLQKEYRAALGPAAEEFDALQEQMTRFWADRMDDGPDGPRQRPWEDPELRRIRERLREIEREHPFDFDEASRRIEALLPADQAAEGRQRRDEMRERRGERGVGRRGERGPGDERRRRSGRRRGGPEGPDTPQGPPPVLDEPKESPRIIVDPPPPGLKHPWATFVREFEERHDLAPPQRAAARAILRESLRRERDYRQSKQAEFEAADALEPAEAREAQLRLLRAPIDEMFEGMRARLNDMLTAEQRGTP